MKTIILLTFFVLAIATQNLLGGWSDRDINEYMRDGTNSVVVGIAFNAANEKAGDNYEFQQVERIRTQIVAGTNTEFIFKYQNKEQVLAKKWIRVIVFEQPWTNTLKVTNVDEF